MTVSTTRHQTHPNARYTLLLDNGDLVDALPTPMLLDQFGRIPRVEAFEDQPANSRYPAIWRMRDDRHDAPGTVYRVVRAITRKHDWSDD